MILLIIDIINWLVLLYNEGNVRVNYWEYKLSTLKANRYCLFRNMNAFLHQPFCWWLKPHYFKHLPSSFYLPHKASAACSAFCRTFVYIWFFVTSRQSKETSSERCWNMSHLWILACVVSETNWSKQGAAQWAETNKTKTSIIINDSATVSISEHCHFLGNGDKTKRSRRTSWGI